MEKRGLVGKAEREGMETWRGPGELGCVSRARETEQELKLILGLA